MRLKTLAVTLLCLLSVFSFGQAKISLSFDTEAARMVFHSSGWPIGLPEPGQLNDGKSIEFPSGSLAADDYLVVWDRDSNNAAIRVVHDIKGNWNVHPSDYTYVGLVKVRVEHDGSPVAAAQIELMDGNRKQSQTLDPPAAGDAIFFGVPPGEIKVIVNYRSNGKQAEPWKQGFELALKRDIAEPKLTVSIPNAVETLNSTVKRPTKEPGKDQEASGSTKPAESKRPSPLATGLNYLFSLAVGAGLIYGILIYIKKNQKAVADHLQNLGVQMPDPTPSGAAPPAPAGPPAAAPQQKIILDDAAPIPASSMSATMEPRLVRETGEVIPLAEGENLVGRDPGLSLSLTGEGTVSRRHASITKADAAVVVKDLGSTNGTYVNGNKIDAERPLSPGDNVQFGQVKFRFEV